ncbi:MAG: NADH-quinone oxidoreductase subunit N [Candidatus Zixiibacteriota bacterium]
MNMAAITPEIILTLGALILMVAELASGGKRNLGWLTAVIILGAAYPVVLHFGQIEAGFSGMILSDRFAQFFRLIILLAGLLATLTAAASWGRRAEGVFGPEYFALLLVSMIGMTFLVTASDLIIVFLALEILSLPLYAMAAGKTASERSIESGAKYFLTGAFASGFVLFGIALVYGVVGSFSLETIGDALMVGATVTPLIWIGGGLILVGFLFKVGAVPFHTWVPDVYTGAPTPTVAFFAAAPKAAAFGLLLRLLLTAMAELPMETIIWAAAWLSMLVGNFYALRQLELKRLLAYSSIAHAGYLLVGLVAKGAGSAGAVGFYLLGYAGMSIGAFAVVCAIESGRTPTTLNSISGMGRRRPVASAALSLFMFGLVGIPPTVGFAGKFVLFTEALKAGYLGLVIWAVLFSAVSVYYYLRVVVALWMWEPTEESSSASTDRARAFVPALALASIITLLLGVFPEPFIRIASESLFWLL